MFRSLRGNLTLLWLFVVVVCGALAFQLHGLFELGVGGEIAQVRQSVELSGKAVQQVFNLYLASFSESPADFNDPDRRRELQLLLDLALGRYYGIEGGFWSPQGKFTAYSFPTHEPLKRDVPEAEASRIETLNQGVFSRQKAETRQFDSSGEVLILHAIPVRQDLVIWTMGRAHVRAAAAFEKLNVGFTVLFLLMLATGALILWYLHRWGRQLVRIEERLAAFQSDSELPKTGLMELDRLIAAFNRQTERLRQLQERSNEMSAELGRAERLAALGRMSAGLAHEIRNPIGAMRLQAENALAKADVEDYQKACRTILRDISRLDDLLERLLAIVRLDRLTIKPTKIRLWIEDCLTQFRNLPGCPLNEIQAPETEWPFDDHQLSRALYNLVVNALQHVPRDGWIKVTGEIDHNCLEIVVEDSGPGVADELKEKIFEPFASYRSDGTGLGLAIARQIVEAHGGTLRCTSGRIGARFEIQLPWREG